jgi:glycosyltransferase involved in cell wall biosynthesis
MDMNRVMTKDKLLVSVVITAYNEEEYIERSANSILSQNYENLELIVVNDGSEDKTEDVLKEKIDDKRLTVINIGRRGRMKALNHGVTAANGRFVAILDADDWCLPRRIERQVDFLASNENVGVVGCDYIRKDTLRNEEYVRSYPEDDDEIRKEMAKYIPLAHSCVMFRRHAVMEVGGYDERLADHEDLDLWIRVAQNWELANIPEPLVVRQIRSDSYWHSQFETHSRDMHLAKINMKAIRQLSLPYHYYIFPLARLIYSWLPTPLKRVARRLTSGIEESELNSGSHEESVTREPLQQSSTDI